MVWNYQNADCSLKNKFIVLFITVIGTLSFPMTEPASIDRYARSIYSRGMFSQSALPFFLS